MISARGACLVLVVAVGAYANSLGNRFAYDDPAIIANNGAVTAPSLDATLLGPYWPRARDGIGLYRPVTLAGFAVQWRAFHGNPVGFHVVSVILHATVCLLLAIVLASFVSPTAALAGALIFAVHPVHVEAVANVVGQSELIAAAATLLACLLYASGAEWTAGKRAARLAAIALLYALGLGAKEIAATLPALLIVVELARRSPEPLGRRLLREIPLYACLTAVLVTYLVLRTAVLGTLAGEVAAPALREITDYQRVLTAISVWPEYLRLLVFPVDLAADYGPAVILPAISIDAGVLAGLVLIAGSLGLAWECRRRAPIVTLSVLWFCVAILPVSNLIVSTGVVLAERTLYLPSVALAIAVAGLAHRSSLDDSPLHRRVAGGLGFTIAALLTARTVDRNPSWFDSYTVMNTLSVEHPESHVAQSSRAEGLARVGDVDAARSAYALAIELVPSNYGLLVEAAEFHSANGDYSLAEALLDRAIAVGPTLPEAYILRAEYHIRQGRGREGHRMALEGLAHSGADDRLYAALSESYVAKGDLEGAARARLAAAATASLPARHWRRLAELYDAMNRPEDARDARSRSASDG